MKRFLSIFLTAVTLILCLCSCSRAELVYGEYESYSEATGETAYIKILSEGRAGFSYSRNKELTYRADYVYDEKAEIITIAFKGYDGFLVFSVEKDKLVFDAEASSDVQETNGIPRLTDGQEFSTTVTYNY